MKCEGCGEHVPFIDSYGSLLFFWKFTYCRSCWFKKNGWRDDDDLNLDELNENRINDLTKRVKKLEGDDK